MTTCVHNLFGGQRSVDQYGELKITNLDKNITCKLTFVKVCFTKIITCYKNMYVIKCKICRQNVFVAVMQVKSNTTGYINITSIGMNINFYMLTINC